MPDRSGISNFLPGLRGAFVTGTKSVVFDLDSPDELASFESGRRLGSPSHWRLYFAFEIPSYALDDAELDMLVKSAATDAPKAEELLRELTKRDHQTPAHYLDMALDRLRGRADMLSADEQVGLARSLAAVMDEVPRGTFAQFTGNDPWRRAAQILRPSVSRYWQDIVTNGRSINWLCYVMRDQGFALGIVNPERRSPEREWLAEEEFRHSLDALLTRLRGLGLQSIFKMPEPLQILYCWHFLGDASELRQLLENETRNDAGLIRTLTAMMTSVVSSDKGYYKSLGDDVVNEFIDAGRARDRLKQMVQEGSGLQGNAAQLLGAWSNH